VVICISLISRPYIRSTNEGSNLLLPPNGFNYLWPSSFAFNGNDSVYFGCDLGILFSSNSGQNWFQIFTTSLKVEDIIITPNIMYAVVDQEIGGVYYWLQIVV
jgi:hypothetical protein